MGADNFGMNELCSIEVNGWVNSMCFSEDRRFLFCGVGREHRLGRWFTDESGAPALLFIFFCMQPPHAPFQPVTALPL
jgi:hypothetical protein